MRDFEEEEEEVEVEEEEGRWERAVEKERQGMSALPHPSTSAPRRMD